MKVRHEVTVGALTVLGIVLMILGYNYLKGNEIFSKNYYYNLSFPNTVGLYPANSVVINGFEVGRVKTIQLAEDMSNQVRVQISLPKDLFIPEDSKFSIESLDLLGKKAIAIERGTSTIMMSQEKVYQGTVPGDMFSEIKDQLDPIARKADKLLASIDTMIGDIHNAIGKGEEGALKKTMDNLTATLQNANKVLADVSTVFNMNKDKIDNIILNADDLMANANQISQKIADNSQNIDSIINNFHTLSSKLSRLDIENTLNATKMTLEQASTLLASINNGEGTLGKIAKDENLYKSIDSTINSLNFLLKDLQAHPKRYVSFSLIERKNKD
ncbi:MAG TPA: MlaD family protein [Chitinophagales bacterium]|nr:MlaD family protein [Chitinophagales bacterium]